MLNDKSFNLLRLLVALPLTRHQIGRILGATQKDVVDALASITFDGVFLVYRKATFTSQFRLWQEIFDTQEEHSAYFDIREKLLVEGKDRHPKGMYGIMQDAIFADCIEPINRRFEAFEPLLKVMMGCDSDNEARLLRWLRVVDAHLANKQKLAFWPLMYPSERWWKIVEPEELVSEETAFLAGMQWVGKRAREQIGFSISCRDGRAIMSVVHEYFPEGTLGRRHIELLMMYTDPETIRKEGGLPKSKGVLPPSVLKTCKTLLDDPRIDALLAPNLSAGQEWRRYLF